MTTDRSLGFLETLIDQIRRLRKSEQIIFAVLSGIALATIGVTFGNWLRGAWMPSMHYPSSVTLMLGGLLLGGWAQSIVFRSQGWGLRDQGAPRRMDPALKVAPMLLTVACCLLGGALFTFQSPAFGLLVLLSLFHFMRTAYRIQQFLYRCADTGE